MSYNFNVNPNATMNHLSEDLYSSYEGAMQKLLRDRIDSVRHADEGVVEIDVYDEVEYTKLRITDNGNGTQPSEVNNIDGVIPYFKLVGKNGGFRMESKLDDEEVSGLWTNQGFKNISDSTDLKHTGTVFEFTIPHSIEAKKLVRIIREAVEYSSTNVILRHYEQGEVIDTYDFGTKSIDDDKHGYKYEDENVKIVYPTEEQSIVYKDVTVPENRIVYTLEGRDTESFSIEIKESDAEVSDSVRTPQLVSGRHRLEENDSFWRWVAEKLKLDEYHENKEISICHQVKFLLSELNSNITYCDKCVVEEGKLVSKTFWETYGSELVLDDSIDDYEDEFVYVNPVDFITNRDKSVYRKATFRKYMDLIRLDDFARSQYSVILQTLTFIPVTLGAIFLMNILPEYYALITLIVYTLYFINSFILYSILTDNEEFVRVNN